MPNSCSQSTPDISCTFTAPSADQWREAALAGLSEGTTLEDLQHRTLDGLDIHVLYHASSPATIARTRPCTLGTQEHFVWDNRLCLSDTRHIENANHALREGLAGGNSSVELHINAKSDITALLQGVQLDIAPVSLRAGAGYEAAYTQLLALAEQQSLAPESLCCSVNADPLSDLLQGKPRLPLSESLEAMARFAHSSKNQMPLADSVLVDCTLHHNAGASSAQELQAGLATAALYLAQLLDAGLSIEQASQSVVLQVACDADMLMGVVKLRSLKQLWQALLLQFGYSDTQALPELKLVVETSRRHLSRLDPWNNHLRNIAACSAAAMGGASSIIVHPHDRVGHWQSGDDPSIGARMARNLPIILERESNLTGVNDPLAGSHAVETLTHELSDLVAQALQDLGDTQAWIESLTTGQWQAELAQTQQRRVAQMQAQTRIAIGVNRFKARAQTSLAEPQEINRDGPTMVQHQDGSVAPLTPVRDSEFFERAPSSAAGETA